MELIWEELIKASIAIAIPLISAALFTLLTRVASRYGFDVQAEAKAKIEQAVRDVLLRVEEWAYRQRKVGVTTSSSAKAAKFLEEAQLVPALADHTPGELKALADQELARLRLSVGQSSV